MVKELTFSQENEYTYTADAYPLDGSPGFYSEYRILLVGGRWLWQLVSVTWDDEDQVTECVNAEGAPHELFFAVVSDANEHFKKGQVNTNPLPPLSYADEVMLMEESDDHFWDDED